MIRVAAAQINPIVGDLAGNKAKIVAAIRQAKAQDADIVAFPELVISGYPPEDLLYKDHFVRDNIKVLHSLVGETKGITAIVGFVDMDKTKRLYNAAAILSDRKIKGVYRKDELPNYGVFDEKRYFHRGKSKKNFFNFRRTYWSQYLRRYMDRSRSMPRTIKKGSQASL